MPLSALHFSVTEQEITKVQVRLAALTSSWYPLLLGLQNTIKQGLETMPASKMPQKGDLGRKQRIKCSKEWCRAIDTESVISSLGYYVQGHKEAKAICGTEVLGRRAGPPRRPLMGCWIWFCGLGEPGLFWEWPGKDWGLQALRCCSVVAFWPQASHSLVRALTLFTLPSVGSSFSCWILALLHGEDRCSLFTEGSKTLVYGLLGAELQSCL